MSTGEQAGTGKSDHPLTRAEVELLRSKVDSSARLDLSYQNLRQIDLTYFDLQSTNLRGADLQGSNLRGANLSGADLREANLSGADLDGADLSHANLGDSELNRVDFHNANLRYTTLRELDLRGFDLTGLDLRHADLNGSDLRDARLRGTDLRGADLSSAKLRGPELSGARLYSDELVGGRRRNVDPSRTKGKKIDRGGPTPLLEGSSPMQKHLVKEDRKSLSDREAYALGEQIAMFVSDPMKTHRLFPAEFDFTIARQVFDAWLVQSGDIFSEKEIQAMWIGFAHQVCDLYHEDEPER